MVDKSVNAGVTAQQGFALQRNMALFVILDNFKDKFEGAKYFVSLEHLEDIVFCFLNDHGHAVKAETYQSKKKANGSWRINKSLAEIIVKILKTGKSLESDPHPKCPNYDHTLYFSTNSTVELETKVKNSSKGGSSETFSENINELNSEVEFNALDEKLKEAIKKSLNQYDQFDEEILSEELNNLRFLFVNLTRVNKEQENQLKGKLDEVFTNKINDPKAALESLFKIFKTVELTYNQKNIARLSDKSKQVCSQDINKAIDIITTKSKAFDYWREQKSAISKKIGIKPFEKETFEMKFTLAFELFKSKDETEHQKILSFVKLNYQTCSSYAEEDCVDELIEKFLYSNSSNLDKDTLKATVYAAYFESIYKTEH
ncbi:DUF4297 domain-containing protein [Shewanella sp. Isolate13]|uniref:DUF4297 domain-containing protein n=1 Tax=Shewanella sp. Isolate13 TaxID=2908531 RepID=UPI001EFD273F|nr:DUF4297 domain-containing protein [Shewanella sp. Isolate13]MCG9732348.1 DUF4297 domain-containing protein [Shewanella sp. Isolate13]